MKQISLNSLRTIVYSHLFLSLCPAALIISTYLIMDNSIQRVSIELLLFVICSSLFIYNLNVLSITNQKANINERANWVFLHQKELKLLLALSSVGILYFSTFISLSSFIFLFHLCLLSVLYVIPVRIYRKEFSIRKFPLLKIFILTYVWVSVTVVLPCIEANLSFNFKFLMLVLERFLFIFALALLFDIRDIELDRSARLITIPNLLGIKYAISIPKLLVATFVALSILFEELNYITTGRVLLAILTMYIIGKAKNRKDDLFYMLGIDGLMILQFFILIILWTINK